MMMIEYQDGRMEGRVVTGSVTTLFFQHVLPIMGFFFFFIPSFILPSCPLGRWTGPFLSAGI